MAGLPYNGEAYNEGGSLASFVYLPASDITIDLAINERNTVTLSGGINFQASYVGDLTKVITFGDTPLNWEFVIDGSLTTFHTINIGQADLSSGFDFTGALSTFLTINIGQADLALLNFDYVGTVVTTMPGPAGAMEWSLDPVADLTKIQVLSGNIQTTDEYTGFLSRGQILQGSIEPDIWTYTGNLGAIKRLEGTIALALNPIGNLSIGLRKNLGIAPITVQQSYTGSLTQTFALTGNIDSSFNVTGDLTRKLLIQIPTSNLSMQINHTGGMQATTRMQGSIVSALTLNGNLSFGRRIDIPAAAWNIQIDHTGSMKATTRMQGAIFNQWDTIGTISITKFIVGNIGLDVSIEGNLSNNASVEDTADLLMFRPYTLREMIR